MAARRGIDRSEFFSGMSQVQLQPQSNNDLAAKWEGGGSWELPLPENVGYLRWIFACLS